MFSSSNNEVHVKQVDHEKSTPKLIVRKGHINLTRRSPAFFLYLLGGIINSNEIGHSLEFTTLHLGARLSASRIC